MIIIPAGRFYPYYIKKEDAKEIIRDQRRSIALVLFSTAVIFGIVQYAVGPKMTDIYDTANQQLPLLIKISPYVTMALLIIYAIIGIYFLITPPDYEKLRLKIKKYKTGELIKTREVLDMKYSYISLLFLFLMVAYMILTTIYPIYNLSNNL